MSSENVPDCLAKLSDTWIWSVHRLEYDHCYVLVHIFIDIEIPFLSFFYHLHFLLPFSTYSTHVLLHITSKMPTEKYHYKPKFWHYKRTRRVQAELSHTSKQVFVFTLSIHFFGMNGLTKVIIASNRTPQLYMWKPLNRPGALFCKVQVIHMRELCMVGHSRKPKGESTLN